jgi:signal transduction histidine kinase
VVQLCGAESAGVSLETFGPEGQQLFQWVAISGVYSPFLNATVPYHWMPCGVCLDRRQPQTLRVPVAHFAAMGLEELPPPITDGILLPWHVGSSRGTIWVLAHGRTDAFDHMDYAIMQMFSDFAAMAFRNQQQQKTILQQTRGAAAAAADMANGLAHQINNPLQKFTNSILLADTQSADAPGHIKQASADLQQLSSLVQQLLALSDKA